MPNVGIRKQDSKDRYQQEEQKNRDPFLIPLKESTKGGGRGRGKGRRNRGLKGLIKQGKD